MKKIIALFLLIGGVAIASEDIEVGSPVDCEVVGKSNDTSNSDELMQIQQKITDCLAPEEKEAHETVIKKSPEVVTQ